MYWSPSSFKKFANIEIAFLRNEVLKIVSNQSYGHELVFKVQKESLKTVFNGLVLLTVGNTFLIYLE